MKNLTSFLLFLSLIYSITNKAQTKNIQLGTEVSLERYAFIIGNDHYQDPAVTTLASCRLDAERFYNFITNKEGTNIKKENTQVLLDANKEQIVIAFNVSYMKSSAENKRLLFGLIQAKFLNFTNYFICGDLSNLKI